MIKYFCDRCGNEMDEDGEKIIILHHNVKDTKSFVDFNKDLLLNGMYCSKCVENIVAQLREKVKE